MVSMRSGHWEVGLQCEASSVEDDEETMGTTRDPAPCSCPGLACYRCCSRQREDKAVIKMF